MYLWFKPAKPKLISITEIQLLPHKEHGEKYSSSSTAIIEILAVNHNRAQKRTVWTTYRVQSSRPGGTYTYHSPLKT